ncbi:hypothetical protein [Nocardia salmonicida]
MVCHGPAALLNATLAHGRPLLQNRNIAGYSWPDEDAARREHAASFDPQDALRNRGVNYKSYVVENRSLITGPNPASARPVAEAVVTRLTT